MQKIVINEAFAQKVLSVVGKGLSSGLGDPIPGQMCVEAAVAFASGEPHSDTPSCVDGWLAGQKIHLNDEHGWVSHKSRARGLKRVAIAQLGSGGKFDVRVYGNVMRKLTTPLVKALLVKFKAEMISEIKKAKELTELADLDSTPEYDDVASIEPAGNIEELLSLLEAANPKWKKEKVLFEAAEIMVQVLKKMKIPGTKYLYLTEKKKKVTKRKAKKRL